MRLLLATTNVGKIQQIRETLADLPFQIVDCSELGFEAPQVDESGNTLEENAHLKARAFFDAASAHEVRDIAALSDDGGFFIDALDGKPGIHAKRWAGENPSDEEIIRHTLKQLEGFPMERRTARFMIVQILMLPDGIEHVIQAKTEGLVPEQAGTNLYAGLPYGALLIVHPFKKIYDELSPEEQHQTHRFIALKHVRQLLTSPDITAFYA